MVEIEGALSIRSAENTIYELTFRNYFDWT